MCLNICNLTTYFDGLQFQKETLILDSEILNNIEKNYKESKEVDTCKLELKKSHGIFAITDTLFNKYHIITFHYVDFRWFSVEMAAKIMHKASVEEWPGNNNYSMKFSESPYQYSGYVCGMMRGDYRDCFKAIKEKEQLNQLLYTGSIDLPDEQNIKIKTQCGIGLNALTKIENKPRKSDFTIGLKYIY